MTKLTTIPTDLQNAINSFFDAQTAVSTEADLWDMFEEFITSANTNSKQNASKAFTYKQLTKLLFTLELYYKS